MTISLENLLTQHFIVPTCDLCQQRQHPLPVPSHPSTTPLPSALSVPLSCSTSTHGSLPPSQSACPLLCFRVCALLPGLALQPPPCQSAITGHLLVTPTKPGRCAASQAVFKQKVTLGQRGKVPIVNEENRLDYMEKASIYEGAHNTNFRKVSAGMKALLTPPLEKPAGVEGLFLHSHPLLSTTPDQMPVHLQTWSRKLRAADVAACRKVAGS